MFIRTKYNELVNLDHIKVIKIQKSNPLNPLNSRSELAAVLTQCEQPVLLYTGEASAVQVALDNIEESIISGAKILDFYQGGGKQ